MAACGAVDRGFESLWAHSNNSFQIGFSDQKEKENTKLNISILEVGNESQPFDLLVFAINSEQTKSKYISKLKKFVEIRTIDSEQKLSMKENIKFLCAHVRVKFYYKYVPAQSFNELTCLP